MMKFIREHTEGPWVSVGPFNMNGHYEVQFGDEECVAEIVHEEPDAKLISKAPVMLDYMIERAEKLYKLTNGTVFIQDQAQIELSRLIEIIKAAGVEIEE